MRLDNVPSAAAITILAPLAFWIGFPAALLWGLGAYAICLITLLAVVVPLPVYDHATPVPSRFAFLGVTSLLGYIYLFVHLAFLRPGEVPILQGVAWLGSLLTLGVLALTPAVVEPILFAVLRRSR